MNPLNQLAEEPGDEARRTPAPELRRGAMAVAVDPGRVAWVLAFLVVSQVLLGIAAHVVVYDVAPSRGHFLARLFRRFDFSLEPNLIGWYSAASLAVAAMLLGVIGLAHRQHRSRGARSWLALALLLLYMSVDEGIQIHGVWSYAIYQWLRPSGVFFIAWLIPGTILAVVVGGLFIPFLARLDRRTRWLFMAAGFIYLSGAIGMEMIGSLILEAGGEDSLAHMAEQAIEEGLEMGGIVIFLYALLDYMRRQRILFGYSEAAGQFDQRSSPPVEARETPDAASSSVAGGVR